MASNNNRQNRQNNQQRSQTPAPTPTQGGGIPITPVTEQAEEKKEEPVTDTNDTVTLASTPPAPVTETENVVEDAPVEDTPAEEEHEHVTALKDMLREFSQLTLAHGTEPKDFKAAARVGSAITQFVIKFPQNPVLDALYDFFEKNEGGAASAEKMLQGGETLTMGEQRQMGFLFVLFRDLADKKFVRISNAEIVKVLKKQDIAAYYNRRLAGFQQNAG